LNSIPRPEETLRAGAAILDPVLKPSGFNFVLQWAGKGSGGQFAFGKYVRGDRFIELHYRHSLGLVTYHLGPDSLDHETYMRSLGIVGQNAYPDFPETPLDSFRSLAKDLERYCGDFLSGDGRQFREFAAMLRENPKRFSELP
jgi:hypothetical protein